MPLMPEHPEELSYGQHGDRPLPSQPSDRLFGATDDAEVGRYRTTADAEVGRYLVARPTALALTVTGLVLCFQLHRLAGPNVSAAAFFLVMMVCVALTLLVRGLGSRVGLGIGGVVGLAASIGLALHFPTPAGNLLAFILIATSIAGFLGHLAGGWESSRESEPLTRVRDDDRAGVERPPTGVGGSAHRSAVCATPQAPAGGKRERQARYLFHKREKQAGSPFHRPANSEELLGAIAADFCDWMESEAGRRCCSEPADWSAFDQFLRTTLRERLGASRVRAYEVSSDGERLETLARREIQTDGWNPSAISEQPSARVGLVGHVVTTGRIYVAGSPGEGAFIRQLAEPDSAGAESQPARGGLPTHDGWPRWAWLLPLRAAKRTTALVAVGRLDRPAGCGLALAEAVRNLVQLFWRHLHAQRTLQRLVRTDRQSGMLNRVELLGRIEETVRASAREGEPVMVLALAVEGLRRLDDTGQWSQRDMLVQRLGRVLLQKVRSDDVLGRFSDDRFIVVLRRLDSALGTLVAEKLMETVRAAIMDQGDSLAGAAGELSGLRLRAGLAGTGLWNRQPACFFLPSMVPTSVRSLTTFDDPMTPAPADAGNAPCDGKLLLERALGLLDYAREQRIDIATDLMKGLPERLTRGGCRSPDPSKAAADLPAATHAAQAGPRVDRPTVAADVPSAVLMEGEVESGTPGDGPTLHPDVGHGGPTPPADAHHCCDSSGTEPPAPASGGEGDAR